MGREQREREAEDARLKMDLARAIVIADTLRLEIAQRRLRLTALKHKEACRRLDREKAGK